MKKKLRTTLAILIGIGIGAVMTSCDTIATATEEDYLKYCGKQYITGGNTIEGYYDSRNYKFIYVVLNSSNNVVSVTAVGN